MEGESIVILNYDLTKCQQLCHLCITWLIIPSYDILYFLHYLRLNIRISFDITAFGPLRKQSRKWNSVNNKNRIFTGHPIVVSLQPHYFKVKMTLAEKVALIEESMQPDFNPVEARNRYNIKKSLYYNIVNRDKEKILNLAAETLGGGEGDRLSMRLAQHSRMEEELLEWLCIQNSMGVPVTNETITNKVNQILPNPSVNWMHNFRKRYKNVRYNRNTKTFHAFKDEKTYNV